MRGRLNMTQIAEATSNRACRRSSGFTLLELLVVMALIATLFTLSITIAGQAAEKSTAAKCNATLRTLGQGILLYATDHKLELPRSWHSAGAHNEPGWAVSIAPYLNIPQSEIDTNWTAVFNKYFRSPSDKTRDPYTYSYAMNVHFELDPNGDDYFGNPSTWRRLPQIPFPSKTVLLGQTRPVPFGDHLMCHQWSTRKAAENALNHAAYNGKSHYLFADGHVSLLTLDDVFSPANGIDLWNPAKAGKKP